MHPLFMEQFRILGAVWVKYRWMFSLSEWSHCLMQKFKEYPTLKILFSIYRIKRTSGQLYFDICPKQIHLVHVQSSNSGYHKQWFYDPNLVHLKPWGEISERAIRYINKLPKKLSVFLKNFHEIRIKYLAKNFSSRRFLNSFACKLLLFLTIILLIAICWLTVSIVIFQ